VTIPFGSEEREFCEAETRRADALRILGYNVVFLCSQNAARVVVRYDVDDDNNNTDMRARVFGL